MLEALQGVWTQITNFSVDILWLSLLFLGLAMLVKGRSAFTDGLRSIGEARLNLIYGAIDLIAIVPIIVLVIDGVSRGVETLGLALFSRADFVGMNLFLVGFLCILVSDFVGYWRHRLMHTAVLWPAHAIHHSDTEMTFTTLMRFHPINRLITTALNALVLALIGFPAEAIALNELVRHYYGYYVHAAIPWTYGPLKYVFVSPVMHRWHHVREIEGSGSNFSTVFAFYDVAFGTFYMPSAATPALGVTERAFPSTWLGQTLYPFRVWARGGRAVEAPPRTLDRPRSDQRADASRPRRDAARTAAD